jgi:hypothetical protein
MDHPIPIDQLYSFYVALINYNSIRYVSAEIFHVLYA